VASVHYISGTLANILGPEPVTAPGMRVFAFFQSERLPQRLHANLLALANNAAFGGLPILWQVTLLPDFLLIWMTFRNVALILGGMIVMLQSFRDCMAVIGS
jgi:hypothetical protein